MTKWGTTVPLPEAPTPVPEAPRPALSAWSYSRLSKYETCPRSAYYAYIMRVPEPTSEAMQRGSDAHAEAAAILTGKVCVPMVLTEDWQRAFRATREAANNDIEAELQIAFTQEWEQTGWFAKDAWCRVIFDGLIAHPAERDPVVRVLEHKTGKARPSHTEQATLYAAAVSRMLPDRNVDVVINYLDQPYGNHGSMVRHSFKADVAAGLVEQWNHRVAPMMKDNEYAPREGRHCNWCHHARSKGGACDRG